MNTGNFDGQMSNLKQNWQIWQNVNENYIVVTFWQNANKNSTNIDVTVKKENKFDTLWLLLSTLVENCQIWQVELNL